MDPAQDPCAWDRVNKRRGTDAEAHGPRRSFVTQQISQLKILALDFVLRYFTWPFPSQYFSWVVVHPVLHRFDLRGLYLVKIRPLGKESPDHAVMIFIASFLPCRIAVTVVDMKPCSAPDAPDQLLILQKFAAVVCGDAAELLPERGVLRSSRSMALRIVSALRSGSFIMISCRLRRSVSVSSTALEPRHQRSNPSPNVRPLTSDRCVQGGFQYSDSPCARSSALHSSSGVSG